MQTDLLSEEIDKYPVLVFSKQVNDALITEDKKDRIIDAKKISKVIDSLLSFGKIKKLEEIRLKSNCLNWIYSILNNYPTIDTRDVKEILNDFSDDMNTRMRTEEKYAICIITSNRVLLAHSVFGEETITPNWEVIDRMLDKDNVLRFVCFEREGTEVRVKYYEENASVFFANWLGLSEKEAFEYLGGVNKFCGEINGTSFALEFSDEDFESKFIKSKVFKIEDNQLILPSPINNIPLSIIRVGKKPYKSFEDFLQDFYAKRYNLSHYKEEYNKIKSHSILPLITKIIDDEYDLASLDQQYSLSKHNPHFQIIFCNKDIEIRPSFLLKIRSKLTNSEVIRIYHPGVEFSPKPVKIKNMEIYNKLNQKVSNIILNFYHSLEIKDSFDSILLYTAIKMLSMENTNKDICNFLDMLANSTLISDSFYSKFVNSENDVFELKGREFITGKDQRILQNLTDDISKKIRYSKIKLYLLGVDEKSKEFEPIPISKFSDDRMYNLEKKLKENHKDLDLKFIKVPSKDNKRCIIILIVSERKDE
ncbi:hypothetical protein ASJ81_13865 [Methanosarcina spelaei]|uniref:Uncharacterized protein n=1 Tax=Methanosarcina spelaei TaxID=1036679 RepID=A0A2A2HYH0_9EURY|nr:hypothetical protein [Methanosarcina spelaei]PAV14408.1 hypothetical protein ASJ81_13865 [Methanosarcina spelaei]